MNANDISRFIGIPIFDYTLYEDSSGQEWEKWLRSFNWYTKANKIEDENEKFVKLLHLAGPKVQELYETLPDEVNQVTRGPLFENCVSHLTEYEIAVNKLNNFFMPKKNSTYERYKLRQLYQQKDENISNFVLKLRKQAERCDFGDRVEENIKDQIIEKCYSATLRQVYADSKRNARKSEIEVGDEVLVKRQTKANKLSSNFETTLYKVMDRKGSEVIVEHPETKVSYRRNVAHVKRFSGTDVNIDELDTTHTFNNENTRAVPNDDMVVEP